MRTSFCTLKVLEGEEMITISFAQLNQSLKNAQGAGGLPAEFEALQDIVTALNFRNNAREFVDFSILWEWYIDHLVELHDKMQKQVQMPGTSYQLNRYDPLKIALARIRAILDTLPEIDRNKKEMISQETRS